MSAAHRVLGSKAVLLSPNRNPGGGMPYLLGLSTLIEHLCFSTCSARKGSRGCLQALPHARQTSAANLSLQPWPCLHVRPHPTKTPGILIYKETLVRTFSIHIQLSFHEMFPVICWGSQVLFSQGTVVEWPSVNMSALFFPPATGSAK